MPVFRKKTEGRVQRGAKVITIAVELWKVSRGPERMHTHVHKGTRRRKEMHYKDS